MTAIDESIDLGGLDPITFEVIRHRMWAINDDQARMAARLSGSPIVFEGYDFNAALTTGDGRGLYCGVYILQHGATIDTFVRQVLEYWEPDEIEPGDLFFTNDPWHGALHANDGILIVPIFAGGQLVAWSGIVTHDADVGSPVPGSFVVGAGDRFGEAPLFPPLRVGRNFTLSHDVERLYLRNSRTPELNALSMRGRVAALRMAHDRLEDLVVEYGVADFVAAQEHILAYVERVLRARLSAIPDGTWHAKGYLDHDGRADAVYPVCCAVTKRGDDLVFDFTGTAAQAVGAINCARPAMEGAVLGVVMISICWDLPWAIGALRNVVEIVAEEGTLNNATGAAAVSMASVMGTLTTMDVASNAFAQLLMASDRFRAEAQANWAPGVNAGMLVAIDPDGHTAMGLITDPFGGGGGARTVGDGVDSGGVPHSMASRIGNVETVESRAPVLQIYRRELPDSGGPGRFRGGVGIESAGVRHKAGGMTLYQTLASGVAVPAGRGLAGGFPGAAASSRVLRGSNIADLLASGTIPTSAADVTASQTEVQQAKAVTTLADDDFVIGVQAGGAGCGDPLLRDPNAVARDIHSELVSTEVARSVYGVVVQDGIVAVPATEAQRALLRARRLYREQTPSSLVADEDPQRPKGLLHRVSESVEAVLRDGVVGLFCNACRYRLSGYEEDYRTDCSVHISSFAETVSGSDGCSSDFELHEYCCPACGTLLAVEVQRHGDTPLPPCSLCLSNVT